MRRHSDYMDENPRGRPSKYKPEFCELLIEHMSKGLSFESFSAIAEVNQDTLHEWVKVHEEFSESKKMAFANCQLFWEKLGVENILNVSESSGRGDDAYHKSSTLNASIWIFNMKNRFKWRDKQPGEEDKKVTHDGAVIVNQPDLADRINQIKDK